MKRYKIQGYSYLVIFVACGMALVFLLNHFNQRSYDFPEEPKAVVDTVRVMYPGYDGTMEWIYEEEGYRGREKQRQALEAKEKYKAKLAKLKPDSIRIAEFAADNRTKTPESKK